MITSMLRKPHCLMAAVFVAGMALLPMRAVAAEPVRFAIQSWPGVTVKTAVARELLESMGYETELQELEPQFVYQGIRSDDVDVSLGAWMPAHEDMVKPLLDDGVARRHAANLEGAVQGLAVPAYTYEAGVKSVEDLVEHGDKFEREIFAIGSGAAMTRAFQDAVEDDYMGLGDWKVTPSSTAGMLSQVDRAIGKEEHIVFHGWKPHWMDVRFDIRFLEADPEDKLAGMETTVYTIVADDWPDANPQAARFLEQFKVPLDAQSVWIDGFSRKEREPEDVARDWIEDNLDVVEKWAEGVETADGGSGIDAIREEFGG
ncbi:MAG: glycine betaine ABC transporter substrate-binding protein [Halofilum sp. (in: g-proteobacteria)]